METTSIQLLLSLIAPDEVLLSFEFDTIREDNKTVIIVMREKTDLVPKALSHLPSSEIVSNGFCNPLDLHTFTQKGKATFLCLYRRRWKQKGKRESYSNNYQFHEPEAKLTDPFAFFLKKST